MICRRAFADAMPRRPPHGGRGLKSRKMLKEMGIERRPPHGGRGLK